MGVLSHMQPSLNSCVVVEQLFLTPLSDGATPPSTRFLNECQTRAKHLGGTVSRTSATTRFTDLAERRQDPSFRPRQNNHHHINHYAELLAS